MEWTGGKDGQQQRIKGINTYPPQVNSVHRMKAYLRRGDVEWAVELHISEAMGKDSPIHPYVQSLLDQYSTVFGDIPPGRHSD